MAEEAAAAPKKKEVKKLTKTQRVDKRNRLVKAKNEARCAINRAHRLSVSKAIKALDALLTNKENTEAVQKQLSEVFSLVDTCPIFKDNKRARIKARVHARLAK